MHISGTIRFRQVTVLKCGLRVLQCFPIPLVLACLLQSDDAEYSVSKLFDETLHR
jgi:hypothetical protein